MIIDVQNDTGHPDGAYASFGAADHAASQKVIANVGAVLDAARAAGSPVFYTIWGAAIVDEITPRDGGVVIDRIRMNALGGTSLDIMLRNLGVIRVVVVGACTNMAVEHTAREAADRGYEVTVVSDATSSLGDDWQRAALGYALTKVATIATTADTVTLFLDQPAGRASESESRDQRRRGYPAVSASAVPRAIAVAVSDRAATHSGIRSR